MFHQLLTRGEYCPQRQLSATYIFISKAIYDHSLISAAEIYVATNVSLKISFRLFQHRRMISNFKSDFN